MKETEVTVAQDVAHTVDASSGKHAIADKADGNVNDVNPSIEKDGANLEKPATIANYFVSVHKNYRLPDRDR